MTEFSIYQINTDRDDNRVCFLGLDILERFQHSKAVDPVLYDRVYDGKLDCNSLETIYEKFNIHHTVEGNSGDRCRVNQYNVGDYEILGYGVPNY